MSADLGLQHTAVRSEKDNIARKRAGRRSGGAQAPTDLRDRKVVVVIPAYNEERFIGSVVLQTCKHADVVLVVDDGSSDATAAIARQAGATVVRHEVNHGKGAALVTALKEARAHNPDVVVMLDADGQHLPEEIHAVIRPVLAGKADIVVGSRYIHKNCRVPLHRVLGHAAFNFLTRLVSGVPASDSQSGYRAFSPRAIERLDFHSDGFAVESEMQFAAREHGLRLVEVPITIRYTDRPKRSVIAHGLMVLNGVLRLTGQYRPLFYFGLPGFALLLLGIGAGAWVVHRFVEVRQFAIGTAMGSLLFILIGLMMLSTGFTLHSIRGLLTDLLRQNGNRQ